MSAPASASATPAAAAAAPVVGGKRAREPTAVEVAQQALLESLFTPGHSSLINGAVKQLLANKSSPAAVAAAEAAAAKKAPKQAKGQAASSALVEALAAEEEEEEAEEAGAKPAAASTNPFVMAMDRKVAVAAAPRAVSQSSKPLARTANNATTFASTKAPNLDMFYHMARGLSREDTHTHLAAAFAENPETALKVLCHARDCHGEGKGEKLVFYYALLWLRHNKPQTYLANLLTFVRHGYFKDISNLVDMLDGGAQWTPPAVTTGRVAANVSSGRAGRGGKGGRGGSRGGRGGRGGSSAHVAVAPTSWAGASVSLPKRKTVGGAFGGKAYDATATPLGGSQLELRLYAEFLKADSLKLKKWRQARKAFQAASKDAKAAAAEAEKVAAAKAAAKAAAASAAASAAPANPVTATSWFDDEDEVVLSDEDEWEDVAEARTQVEAMDISESASSSAAAPAAAAPAKAPAAAAAASASAAAPMAVDAAASSGPAEPAAMCFISLAAKYAPSERKHFGSQAKRLAKILFAGDAGANNKDHASGGFTNAAHMQSCLKKYRSLLSTLRAHLCITERFTCSGQWDRINYNAVPSKCHQLLKKAFQKHSPERYQTYLAGLKKGVGKINVTGLAPHELVGYYLNNPRAEENETVEAAWKALVDKVKETGTFTSAVAVVDVSGSMSGTPMLVAIAMGLLVSALSTGPFQGRVLTFHESPSWHAITGDTLKAQVACLAAAPWGGSTNFSKTFDLILDVAKKYSIAQEHMPQTMFCFSDMQFDEACSREMQDQPKKGGFMLTNYQVAKRKYESANYKVPNIVFWNLNGALNKDAPVQCDTPGCALMSGFSASLLNVFLRSPIVAEPAEGVAEAMTDEEAAENNPLHPLAIMMDSIKSYDVIVVESERTVVA